MSEENKDQNTENIEQNKETAADASHDPVDTKKEEAGTPKKEAAAKNTAETKTEPVQEAAAKNTAETKTEPVQETASENKAESQTETAKEETKTEGASSMPHADGSTASAAQPKKAKKPFPWKPVLKVCGIVILAAGCGFGGGYVAGKQSASEAISEAESEIMNGIGSIQIPGGFGSGGSSTIPGDGSSSSDGSDSTTSEGAALGLYVTTNTDGSVVISGFSSNSNAETAGLKTGDIITALDDTTVSSYSEITSFLAEKSVGDTVKVTVTRDGSSVSVELKLVEKSSSSSSSGSSSNGLPSQNAPDSSSGATSSSGSSSQYQG